VRERLLVALAVTLIGCAAPRSESRAPAAQDSTTEGTAADTGGGEAEGEAAPMVQPEEAGDDSVQLVDEQSLAMDALEDALRLANCDDAFGHRDAICDLSQRICDIADDHPRAARRCEDAEDRCANARERVADECE
jgi:hypothetical protein